MDKPTESSTRKPATPTTTDDESLTTSVASDTLDSWTLVTEKQKNPKTRKTKTEDDENHIENLPKYEDLDLETSHSVAEEEQEIEPSPEHHGGTTSATDEFSDEVSIISESENSDILTPHPYLPEHLQTLNLKFTTGEGLDLATLLQQQQQEEHRLQQQHKLGQITIPNVPIQLQQRSNSNNNGSYQTRQRRRQRSPSVDGTEKTNKTEVVAPPVPVDNRVQCVHQPRSFIRRTYTLFFYFLVGLALLGFYGKFSLSEWPMFSGESSSSINTLEKKLIDMELQNNLMRAEIDLLTKQVNHLKTLNPSQNAEKYDKRHQTNNDRKQHTKDELKYTAQESYDAYKGYKTGHQDNKVAGTMKNTVEHQEKSQATVEEEKKETVMDPFENTAEATITEENRNDQPPKDYNINERLEKDRSNKRNGKKSTENFSKNEERSRKHGEGSGDFKRRNKKYNSKEREDDDDSKERRNFRRNSRERHNDKDNSSERRNSRENKDHKRNNKDYHDGGHDDKYRNQYHREDNHYQKHHRDHSGERFNHKKDNDGEWHEKLMQQREKARNEHEQRLNREKNWYLNRKNGREQWRSDEMNHR